MADLADKHNWHLFLEKMNNKNNSFIANVNMLAGRIDVLSMLLTLFDEERIQKLLLLDGLNLDDLVSDLKKGTYNGYRKLDIDLLTNFKDYSPTLTDAEKVALWSNPANQVYYGSITVYFNDKTSITKDFSELGIAVPINNHHKLYDQLDDWAEFKAKAGYTMFDIMANTPIPNHELLRIWDGEDGGSQIDKIVLHVANSGINQAYDAVFAGVKEYDPVFTWLDTTSIIATVSNKINQLIPIGDKVKDLLVLYSYLNELTQIYGALDKLVGLNHTETDTIFNHLSTIVKLSEQLEKVEIAANIANVLDSIEHKANKIEANVPVYSVANSIITNNTENCQIGDTFTSDPFTFTVTQLDINGKVVAGTVTPASTYIDYSGRYQFKDANGNIALVSNIVCNPTNTYVNQVKDLIDVYNELKNKASSSSSIISDLTDDFDKLEKQLLALDTKIDNLEFGDSSSVLSDFVFKTSILPQTINSDLILGLNKILSGLRPDGTAYSLLSAITLAEGAAVRPAVRVGNPNVHLNLQTSNDVNHGDRVTVDTANGRKEIAYVSDLADDIVVNFLAGSCIAWAGTTIPPQCKVAVGDTYNIADFPEAGAVLGTKYGGDGVTTFGTPDLRNVAPTNLTWIIVLGKDNGSTGRLYCGRPEIYCGKEGLYCGMTIIESTGD